MKQTKIFATAFATMQYMANKNRQQMETPECADPDTRRAICVLDPQPN